MGHFLSFLFSLKATKCIHFRRKSQIKCEFHNNNKKTVKCDFNVDCKLDNTVNDKQEHHMTQSIHIKMRMIHTHTHRR